MIRFDYGWSSFGLGFRVTRYLGGWVLICMLGPIDVSYERVRKAPKRRECAGCGAIIFGEAYCRCERTEVAP